MANITFDLQWREAMTDLLEQLEAEAPEDPALAPQTLTDYACMYIKYLQIYNKLEESYDQMVHPQKRLDLKKALEACIGRLLEVKAWLVTLNDGRDVVNLDDTLVDLKLGPDVLEVRAPRYYRNDRAVELDSRQQFLLALMEKYERPATADDATATATAPEPSAMSQEEAIAILQANERGRQARARVKALLGARAQQEEDLRRQRMGGDNMSAETAAIKMQAAARGFLAKRRARRMVNEELVFIGMKPPARDSARDPVLREVQNLARRKGVQAANRIEYEECVVSMKKRVKEIEGQDMREMIQDRVNKWFLENRDPVTGNYPDFPGADVGGSKVILNPPIVDPNAGEEENAKDGKGKGDKKDGDKKDKGGDKKGGKDDKKGKKDPPEEAPPEPAPACFFAKHVKDAVQSYCATWQDKDETTNFVQRHDVEMVKATLRPLVFEEVRQEVDVEMAVLLQKLKDMVAAEKAGGSPKRGKKGGKKGDKKAKSGDGAKKEKKPKSEKAEKGGGGKKGKKDPTGDRSAESLYAELVSNGIVQPCPPRGFAEFVGAYSYLGTTLEKADIRPDPSLAQVRQLVTEYCVLPIGSRFVHENSPFFRSVLLYGPPGCGTTLLAHAACHGAGANLINLSPAAIAGRYGGKQVALMLHLAFKLARVMAPTVILVDQVEQVFSSDKKKAKKKPKDGDGGAEGEAPVEPPSRIKKELLKEMKGLAPGDRVVVIGCTSRPQDCSSSDSKALINAFAKHIHVPLPDYASLRLLWPALVERNGGGPLPTDFDLSTLCTMSLGYPPGAIDRALKMVLTERRRMKLAEKPLTLDEIMAGLYRQQAVNKEDDQALRDWATKLPANQPKTPPEEPEDAKKKGGKDAKGGKKK